GNGDAHRLEVGIRAIRSVDLRLPSEGPVTVPVLHDHARRRSRLHTVGREVEEVQDAVAVEARGVQAVIELSTAVAAGCEGGRPKGAVAVAEQDLRASSIAFARQLGHVEVAVAVEVPDRDAMERPYTSGRRLKHAGRSEDPGTDGGK